MQHKGWKNYLFMILLTAIGTNRGLIGTDVAHAANSHTSKYQNGRSLTIKSLVTTKANHQPCPKSETEVVNHKVRQIDLLELGCTEKTPSNVIVPKPLTAQSNPVTPSPTSPQLETQPNNFSPLSPKPIEQLLDAPQTNYSERLQRLLRRLEEGKQRSDEPNNSLELGLRVRPVPLAREFREQPPLPQIEPPVAKFKPIGLLQAHVGYFNTSNVFSSNVDTREDGLIFSGLTLASAYLPLGAKTYLNGSIDGNLIRYVNQSQYDYNQVKFNLGIYQQLSPRMYGEIGWSNQQLFSARSSDFLQAGDRFLSENSLKLSLGRRDYFTKTLMLDSSYEFSLNFAEPNNRSRIINSLLVSLNYYLQKPLEVGLNYQLNWSEFTERQRDDQYHRLFGHLIYRLSDSSNVNLQGGVSFGDSTDKNINFDTWFFSINYNLEIGKF
jgi:hypothetical protein